MGEGYTSCVEGGGAMEGPVSEGGGVLVFMDGYV